MSQWRKQQDQSHHHHQMGHWRSSSYNKKPPLNNWHSKVPSWEKMFCTKVGAIPWQKLLESQRYMYLYENVVNWDDSSGKEAFDNAKSRFWADINGLQCNISLPDPDIYIDDVDWNSSVDPELLLDLERDATADEVRDQEVVILNSSLLMDQSFSCTGWGDLEEATPKPYDMNQSIIPTGWGDAEEGIPNSYDMNQSSTPTGWGDAEEAIAKPYDMNQSFTPTGWGDVEEEAPKPSDPVSASQGWERNLRENNQVGSWGKYRHDSCGWNQRSHYGGNRNWGTWDGYNRKRENMTWSRTPTHHNNEYQMKRGGRRNNRGRGRGNFAHHDSYAEKVPTATQW